MTKEELIIGFFEKGYCCDLDEVKDTCLGLIKENQELKKQLEELTNYYCESSNIKRKRAKKIIELKIQQKEFIKYLQEEINVQIQEESIGCEITNKRCILEEILKKYKEIIRRSEI